MYSAYAYRVNSRNKSRLPSVDLPSSFVFNLLHLPLHSLSTSFSRLLAFNMVSSLNFVFVVIALAGQGMYLLDEAPSIFLLTYIFSIAASSPLYSVSGQDPTREASNSFPTATSRVTPPNGVAGGSTISTPIAAPTPFNTILAANGTSSFPATLPTDAAPPPLFATLDDAAETSLPTAAVPCTPDVSPPTSLPANSTDATHAAIPTLSSNATLSTPLPMVVHVAEATSEPTSSSDASGSAEPASPGSGAEEGDDYDDYEPGSDSTDWDDGDETATTSSSGVPGLPTQTPSVPDQGLPGECYPSAESCIA